MNQTRKDSRSQILTCDNKSCGIEFRRINSAVSKGKNFCCKECSNESRAEEAVICKSGSLKVYMGKTRVFEYSFSCIAVLKRMLKRIGEDYPGSEVHLKFNENAGK